MENAIEIKNLGKQYVIKHNIANSYNTLRGQMSDFFGKSITKVFRKNKKNNRDIQKREEFWALRSVTLNIKVGERVGIIGKNGAGKSTLLKLMSRITEPTEGWIKIRGRVSSLLEVGTGFHPELTGRENIFLNGAILGMTRIDIRKKFDEIVAFSGISKFLDTPIKRYSSGMFVRLAFAVAAHLEPEVLIVDEVLAVGDLEFQKKCLGKMDVISREGRTVLFVSHNMTAIQSLCERCVLLRNGEVEHDGEVAESINRYHHLIGMVDRKKVKRIRGIEILSVRCASKPDQSLLTPESSFSAEVKLYTEFSLPKCYFNFVIEDSEGRFVIHSRTDLHYGDLSFDPGMHRVKIHLPRLSIRAGVYMLWFRLYVNSGEIDKTTDSERILLRVTGPQVSGLVDVPCEWSWDQLDD